MEGVHVLTALNTHKELERQAKSCGLPWLFVGSQVCTFADYLRSQGVFFVTAGDPETINTIQPSLRDGRDCCFGLPNGHLFVHPKDTAMKVLDYHGNQHMSGLWATAKPHLEKFMDHLYTFNVFVARADAGGKTLLDEKTKLQNVTIRMRIPESETL